MDAVKSAEVKKEGDKKKRKKDRKARAGRKYGGEEGREGRRKRGERKYPGGAWPCKTAQHSIRFKLAFT